MQLDGAAFCDFSRASTAAPGARMAEVGAWRSGGGCREAALDAFFIGAALPMSGAGARRLGASAQRPDVDEKIRGGGPLKVGAGDQDRSVEASDIGAEPSKSGAGAPGTMYRQRTRPPILHRLGLDGRADARIDKKRPCIQRPTRAPAAAPCGAPSTAAQRGKSAAPAADRRGGFMESPVQGDCEATAAAPRSEERREPLAAGEGRHAWRRRGGTGRPPRGGGPQRSAPPSNLTTPGSPHSQAPHKARITTQPEH